MTATGRPAAAATERAVRRGSEPSQPRITGIRIVIREHLGFLNHLVR